LVPPVSLDREGLSLSVGLARDGWKSGLRRKGREETTICFCVVLCLVAVSLEQPVRLVASACHVIKQAKKKKKMRQSLALAAAL
jgi:hypothetical protein